MHKNINLINSYKSFINFLLNNTYKNIFKNYQSHLKKIIYTNNIEKKYDFEDNLNVITTYINFYKKIISIMFDLYENCNEKCYINDLDKNISKTIINNTIKKLEQKINNNKNFIDIKYIPEIFNSIINDDKKIYKTANDYIDHMIVIMYKYNINNKKKVYDMINDMNEYDINIYGIIDHIINDVKYYDNILYSLKFSYLYNILILCDYIIIYNITDINVSINDINQNTNEEYDEDNEDEEYYEDEDDIGNINQEEIGDQDTGEEESINIDSLDVKNVELLPQYVNLNEEVKKTRDQSTAYEVGDVNQEESENQNTDEGEEESENQSAAYGVENFGTFEETEDQSPEYEVEYFGTFEETEDQSIPFMIGDVNQESEETKIEPEEETEDQSVDTNKIIGMF